MIPSLSRNPFTGSQIEYVIPKSARVVFVNDFFVSDVQGGAELTSEALIAKSPHKVARIHSASVTRKLIDSNKDKHWIFGNFSAIEHSVICYIPFSGINYSVIEYDFKYCMYRSPNRHRTQAGHDCDCAYQATGQAVEKLFLQSNRVFWMSKDQRDHYFDVIPSLEHSCDSNKHVILSSVFTDETLDKLARLRASSTEKKPVYAVLGSGSWIKGIEETQNWCKLNRKPFEAIPNMPYGEFLARLSQYKGFVFMPLDFDTCPRVTIEAKLLGCELILNNNVLNKNDYWFTGSIEECEEYMRGRAKEFWSWIVL